MTEGKVKGVLQVESRASSPERAGEFDRWYEDVHMPEVLALDGFVSARRYAAPDGSFVSLYEIEGDDLKAVVKRMFAAARTMSMSDSMQLDPPPVMRVLELTAELP